MIYYVSQYLNVYPSYRDSSILFHGITGAMDEVEKELGHLLKSTQSRQHSLEEPLSTDLLQFLEQRGHLTQKTPEEEWKSCKDYISRLHDKMRSERLRSGSLMIVPSYYCNLACAYCYQNPMRAAEGKGAALVMSPETADIVFTGILKNLFPSVDRLGKISVNLYGGEPFLERNKPTLERILFHTKQHQMEVSAISNASALDGCLDYFGVERGRVGALQISFDGDKLHHDKSRITHYGQGTFDVIVANIHRLIDRGVRINLRANTNKHNVATLGMLWERLVKEEITTHPHVTMYAAAIHNHFNQIHPEPLFSPAMLTRRMEEQKLPVASPLTKKINRLASIFEAEQGIVLARTNFCMQNTPNAFLVDHRRDIYSCYEEAGNRQLKVGQFDECGSVSLNERYPMYQSRHIGMYEPCSKCPVGLTCGGGCPVAARGALWNKGTIFTNHCDSHKELVAMAIKKLFKEKTEGLKSARMAETEWLKEQPYA